MLAAKAGVEQREEEETARIGVDPSIADDGDTDELTALNLQVDFVPAEAPPAMRPRLDTLPMSDAEVGSPYVKSAAVPQPPPSVPSLSSLEVPNVETRRIDAETLAEVLARNTARAVWKTPSRPMKVVKAAPRWERRIGVMLLALATSMVVLSLARPDLVAKSVTWLEAVVRVAKA